MTGNWAACAAMGTSLELLRLRRRVELRDRDPPSVDGSRPVDGRYEAFGRESDLTVNFTRVRKHDCESAPQKLYLTRR